MTGFMTYLCQKCWHEVTIRCGFNTCPNCKTEGWLTGSYKKEDVKFPIIAPVDDKPVTGDMPDAVYVSRQEEFDNDIAHWFEYCADREYSSPYELTKYVRADLFDAVKSELDGVIDMIGNENTKEIAGLPSVDDIKWALNSHGTGSDETVSILKRVARHYLGADLVQPSSEGVKTTPENKEIISAIHGVVSDIQQWTNDFWNIDIGDEMDDYCKRLEGLADIIEAALSRGVTDGMVLVPIHATEIMQDAGVPYMHQDANPYDAGMVWQAMIAAYKPPEQSTREGVTDGWQPIDVTQDMIDAHDNILLMAWGSDPERAQDYLRRYSETILHTLSAIIRR